MLRACSKCRRSARAAALIFAAFIAPSYGAASESAAPTDDDLYLEGETLDDFRDSSGELAAETGGEERLSPEFVADAHQVGYAHRPVFGGPESPEGQLEENDRVREAAFEFPAIYEFFDPWRDFKRRLNEKRYLQLTGHYATMFQGVSDSLTGEDTASSGAARLTVKWTVIGRDSADPGAIIMTVDHRHKFGDIAPVELGQQAGYLGVTARSFADTGLVLINLNWQQSLNRGRTGVVLGRYDPGDYQNTLGYTSSWSSFSNQAILLDNSVARSSNGWGAAAGHWFTEQWYAMAGFNDANGSTDDELQFFEGGAEFYSWGHVGWSPSRGARQQRNVHLTIWHADGRADMGTESSDGIAMAANWTINDRWMPFARAGISEGNVPTYNKSFTLGFVRRALRRADLAGFAVNWGQPPEKKLREQTTIEAFWRFQFARNLALTPNVQLLLNPALNPTENTIWVTGLRIRMTF